jgi:hypothetical protein
MEDFNFDEIDKAIKQEMSDTKAPAKSPTSHTQKQPTTPPKNMAPRGHYIDIIPARRVVKPVITQKPAPVATVVKTTTFVQEEEVDIITEVPKQEIPTAEELRAEKEFIEDEITVKTTELSISSQEIAAKSPFIETVNIPKRPLSPDVPSESERAIRSSKNIYSSRSPLVSRPEKSSAEATNSKKDKKVKKSRRFDWFSALIVLLIVIFGSAIGFILYILFTQ